MIPNRPFVQQTATAAMPEYYQQNLTSPNQAEINKPAKSENAPKTHCHCCVDLSHMEDFHYMDDFHHMHDHHHMHDYHHMHDFHHMHDYHHMHDFHPMDHYHPMHDFHPAMQGSWDPHMHGDHHHPHEGWEFTSIDYHHESFHPYVHPHHMHHMHYMHHPICYPVVCYPADKDQKGQPR
ncbi:hypothetical protein [Paenibacillus sp. LHD-38]|uniref:hypothetical protein n=1 Tax=Paenibacillus sp. LHD-38 TaxID=3072143 RepID=UPI00280EC316|nr:hypothetical protein [Paenibacillus sp. LHD-38]MDQ8733940.1 hypothetical protein [Paenibacillus sp. LHD-38]